jgi:transketolase
MVSFAGGLALRGRLPVVSSYAAFLERALEQVKANAAMGARVLYAGNYAGLDYHSDGRSHQCLDDLMRLQGIPGLALLEPTTPTQAARLLDWAALRAPGSVYLRLHRSPQGLPLDRDESGLFDAAEPRSPLVRGRSFRSAFVTLGPLATRLAVEAQAQPDFAGFGLCAVCALDEAPRSPWRALLAHAQELIAIEETWPPGALVPWLEALLRRLDLRPRLRALQPRGWGSSFRSLDDCRRHFGFTVEGLRTLRRT